MKLSKRGCFYTLLALLLLLLAVRYIFQIEIPRMVLTVLLTAMAILGDKTETIAVAMGCIPLHQAVDFYIVIVACAGILILKEYQQTKVGVPVILVLLMIAWELSHCFVFLWTPNTLMTALAPLLFIAVCLSMDLTEVDYAVAVRLMAILAAYMGLLQLIIYLVRADGNLIQLFATLDRLGSITDEETMLGGAINSNTLGIINVLSITGLLQIRAMGVKKKADMVLFSVLLFLGVLTQSKTFLVCLLIMFVLVLFHQRSDWKRILRILGGTVLICLLILVVMNLVFPQTLIDFAERFLVADITTGRDDIMGHYHEYISSNPDVMFFGVGLSEFAEKVTNVYKISINTPHNSLQEILVAWGIPGLFLLAALLLVILFESLKHGGRKTTLNWIPLVIIGAKCMAGQLLTSGYTMVALIFCYLSLCQDFSGTRKELTGL